MSTRVGVARLQADYRVYGHQACMVFYFTVPRRHPVTQEDVNALVANYITWERGLGGFFDGYSMQRDAGSFLERTRCWGVGPDQPFVMSVDFANVQGFWRGSIRQAPVNTVAPSLRWVLPDGVPQRGVRTYAVGYAAAIPSFVDPLNLGQTDRSLVASVFGILQTFMANNGATLVHVSRSPTAANDSYGGVYPLIAPGSADAYMRPLRRRQKLVPSFGGRDAHFPLVGL